MLKIGNGKPYFLYAPCDVCDTFYTFLKCFPMIFLMGKLSLGAWGAILLGLATTEVIQAQTSSGEEEQNKVHVIASVDGNSVTQGQTFTLSVRVTSNGSVSIKEPKLPHLGVFDFLSQSTSSQFQSSFGSGGMQTKRTKIFHYTLLPKKIGSHVIGSIEVVVSGRAYTTDSITLKVESPGSTSSQQQGGHPQGRPRQGGRQGHGHGTQGFPQRIPDPFGQMDDMFNNFFGGSPGQRTPPQNSPNSPTPIPQSPSLNTSGEPLFLEVHVDKTKAYVGEQIMVSWYIYTRGHVRDLDTLKHPSNQGFWKEDIHIAQRLKFQSQVVNGILYHRALLASYALFPLKEGEAVIDSYKVKCTFISRNSYGFRQPTQLTKSSEPVTIEVMPLPQENRPSHFSGAVGMFQVRSELDNSKVSTNQPVTLKIKITGRGNAKLIDLPSLNEIPKEIEVYDTKADSKFFKSGQGYKEFEVILVPRSSGSFVVPSLSFNAFDPEAGSYYQKKTNSHILEVLLGEDEVMLSSSNLNRQKENPPQLPGVIASWKSQGWDQPYKWTFWILVYMLIFAFLIWRWKVEFGRTQKKKDLRQWVHIKTHGVEELVKNENWREVGTVVTNLTCKTLGEIANLGGANVELEKLILKLPPSVRRELGEAIQRQNKIFEVLSFAPDEMMGRLKDRDNVLKHLSVLKENLLQAIELGFGSEEGA